jgi:hypothetical protein
MMQPMTSLVGIGWVDEVQNLAHQDYQIKFTTTYSSVIFKVPRICILANSNLCKQQIAAAIETNFTATET